MGAAASIDDGELGQRAAVAEYARRRAAAMRDVRQRLSLVAVRLRHDELSRLLTRSLKKLDEVINDPATSSERAAQLKLLLAELEDVQVRLLFVAPK